MADIDVDPVMVFVELGVWSPELEGLRVPVPVMERLRVLEELVDAVTVGDTVIALLGV